MFAIVNNIRFRATKLLSSLLFSSGHGFCSYAWYNASNAGNPSQERTLSHIVLLSLPVKLPTVSRAGRRAELSGLSGCNKATNRGVMPVRVRACHSIYVYTYETGN